MLHGACRQLHAADHGVVRTERAVGQIGQIGAHRASGLVVRRIRGDNLVYDPAVGRAMFDLNNRVYRHRELSRDPLPFGRLRFASPREERASQLVGAGAVTIAERSRDAAGSTSVLGTIREGGRGLDAALTIDSDERILRADCTCNWHQQNRLRKGPCEHILALRIAHARHVV